MRDSINREGLTFEEWVCSAGYAHFGYLNQDGIFPYSLSEKVTVEDHGKQIVGGSHRPKVQACYQALRVLPEEDTRGLEERRGPN